MKVSDFEETKMSALAESLVEKTLEEFFTVKKKPEEFLNVQTKLADRLKKTTKQLYDFNSLCQDSGDKPPQALPELITDNFDEEQIWQELELYNDPHIIQLLTNVSQLVASKNSIQFKTKKKKLKKLEIKENDIVDSEPELDLEENSEESELDNEISKYKSQLEKGDQSDSEDDNDFDFDAVEVDESDENILKPDKKVKEPSKPKSVQKSKPSIVDDNFFKLSQLETFLTEQENRDEKQRKKELGEDVQDDEEEDIDIFQDITDDEGEDARNAMYSEFFDDADLPESREKNVRFKDQEESRNLEEDEVQEDQEAEAEEDMEEDKEDGVDDGEEENEGGEEDDEEEIGDEDEIEGGKSEEDDEENDFNELMKTKDQNKLLREDESEGEDINEVLGGGKEEAKSSYELRQEKLKKQITKLEVSNLASKPWQMSGEVVSTLRPENSLLEEHLQFDHTTKMIPVITEETSKSIEDIIIQRIKDKAWDDVERKVKPTENTMEYKKRIVLDQEKSKQSLAQIYEDEYIKQQKKDKEEDEEETNPEREVIKEMMQSLFIKLDALSNFHYTPKHIQPELRVISNLPSITMEEVAPVSKSDAQLVAPEEIKAKVKGELKGTTEKSETDRKRERRRKKAEKRTQIREKERREKLVNKMNPGLGNKYSKESALKDLEKSSKINKNDVTVVKSDKKKSSLTSSTTFFKQLQEEVQSQVLSRKAEKQKRKNQVVTKNSAKKLKL